MKSFAGLDWSNIIIDVGKIVLVAEIQLDILLLINEFDEHLITTTGDLNSQTQISVMTFETHGDIKGPARAEDRIVNNAVSCEHLHLSFRPLTLREKLVVDAGKYFN